MEAVGEAGYDFFALHSVRFFKQYLDHDDHLIPLAPSSLFWVLQPPF
jgi:hypothetical protein